MKLAYIFVGIIILVTILVILEKYNRRVIDETYLLPINTPKLLGCNLNHQDVVAGINYFRTKKLIICGLLRDKEMNIPLIKQNLTKLAGIFKDYTCLIVENDSQDDTREQLLEWNKENPRVIILGCGVNVAKCSMKLDPTLTHNYSSKRIGKMVMLRNIYLNYISTNKEKFNDYDFVAIWDMDIVGTFYLDGLASSGLLFKNNPEIKALCANGTGISNLIIFHKQNYYDTYAHAEYDGQQMEKKLNNLFMAYEECTNVPRKVESCFSGFTLYRKDAIENKKYFLAADETDQIKCEHKTLHEQLRDGVYINPQMLFTVVDNNY